MSVKAKLRTTRGIGIHTGLGTTILEVGKVNEVEFSDAAHLNVALDYGFIDLVVEGGKVQVEAVKVAPKVEVKKEVQQDKKFKKGYFKK